jgi:hypothetical protein
MKVNPFVASTLSLCLIVLPACSASRARDEVNRRWTELDSNNAAWEAARMKLSSMCPNVPKTAAEYQKGIQIRSAGNDPFRGCDLRLIKLTNGPTFDDWDWVWFPNYTTIVAVHEEELRSRLKPKVYEEYIIGLSRHLAKRVDSGDISPEQFMHAFNEGWKWLYGKTEEEQLLLQSNLQSAEQSDAAAWNTLSSIATGLATVATVAIIASAAVSASRPAPTNCYIYGNYVQCN